MYSAKCRLVLQLVLASGIALSMLPPLAAQAGDKFGYHEVRTDSQGGIVPWYGSGPSEAYDHNLRLIWNFWITMRNCQNGVPYYLQHQVWKAEADDPRGLGGDQIDMALSSWNLLYGYLGDPAIKQNMVLMADYWLDHGMSRPDLLWGNLPYPYDLDVHSGTYDGDMRAGKGYLQPDKAGSFGAELVMLYKLTGNAKYLDAATAIANTLAARVQPGDRDHSPWPFRVNASTGEVNTQVADGKTWDAAYTSNWSPTLGLFEELITLKHGKVADYKKAFQTASAWVKAYPLKTNKWGPFFEDIDTAHYSDTEINADTMAAYILNHPQWDPDWQKDTLGILNWSYSTLANHEFEKARLYSDEERKERSNLRALREQFNLEESPPRVPLLCIEIIRDERFSEVQKRCDDYIAQGVTQVWLLDPDFKRAYTVTKTEGLREFKGGILQIANPPLEMDLRRIFD